MEIVTAALIVVAILAVACVIALGVLHYQSTHSYSVAANVEGELLGTSMDDDNNVIYWYRFGGVVAGFGSNHPGDAQGAPDDGGTTYGELGKFHRGSIRGAEECPPELLEGL